MSATATRLRSVGPVGGLGLLAILGVGFVHFYLRFFGDPQYAYAPKINVLFILNAVFAVVFVVAFLWRPHWTLAAVGVGFALSTMASYLYSRYNSTGLFKFKELRIDNWGWASLTCEVVAALCLGFWAFSSLLRAQRGRNAASEPLAAQPAQTPVP